MANFADIVYEYGTKVPLQINSDHVLYFEIGTVSNIIYFTNGKTLTVYQEEEWEKIKK